MTELAFYARFFIVALSILFGVPVLVMLIRIFWLIGTDAGLHALKIRQANRQKDTAPDNKDGKKPTIIRTNNLH